MKGMDLKASADIRDLVCGRLDVTRAAAAETGVRVGSTILIPIALFVIVAYASDDEIKKACTKWWRLECAKKVVMKPYDLAVSSIMQFLRAGDAEGVPHKFWRWTLIISMLMATYVIIRVALIYVWFRLHTLHFQYKTTRACPRKEGITLVTDRIPREERARGLKCNPGLARDKATHLRSVYAMLSDLVTGSPCRAGTPDLVDLQDAKVHVRIAARNISSRTLAHRSVADQVTQVLFVVAGLFTVGSVVAVGMYIFQDPSWIQVSQFSCTLASVTAIVTLVCSTVMLTIRRDRARMLARAEAFDEIVSRVHGCRTKSDCKRALAEVIGDDNRFSAGLNASKGKVGLSSKVLATLVLSIGILGIIRSFSTETGVWTIMQKIHKLQTQSGGTGGMSVGIQKIPQSHVAYWMALLNVIAIAMAMTAWSDMCAGATE